jgi:putative oligomerization/nucleic acid binding protein
MFGRRGPGLIRAAAATAVVAGTAGAVRHRQEQRWVRQDQEAYEQQMAQQQAYSQQPVAPSEPDWAGEIEKLAHLRSKGIITEEEFEAKKKQLLGL